MRQLIYQKCDKSLQQNESVFYYKMLQFHYKMQGHFYKMRQLLQNETFMDMYKNVAHNVDISTSYNISSGYINILIGMQM